MEWESLPHIIVTSDVDWDPSVLDHDIGDDDTWFDALSDIPQAVLQDKFDETGDYHNCIIIQEHLQDANSEWYHASKIADECAMTHMYKVHMLDSLQGSMDPYNDLIPTPTSPMPTRSRRMHPTTKHYALCLDGSHWTSFKATTQYACLPMSTLLKKCYKSPFPALNVHQCNEPIATDTIYSDNPAINSGATIAQVFVGTESLVTDVYSMKTDKQFVNTLEDQIQELGAPNQLISDRAHVEMVKEILRAYCITDWQSEPHYQHQNFAKQCIQQLKTLVNTIMDHVGAPPEA